MPFYKSNLSAAKASKTALKNDGPTLLMSVFQELASILCIGMTYILSENIPKEDLTAKYLKARRKRGKSQAVGQRDWAWAR